MSHSHTRASDDGNHSHVDTESLEHYETCLEDPPSSDDGSESKFHPESHLTSSSDPIILQSNDGICFRVSQSTLASHSSFFRDLCDHTGVQLAQTQIIDLPSATSFRLYLALHLLLASSLDLSKCLCLPCMERTTLLSAIRNAFTIFDPYDISER